jgi:hypothetical protein
MQQTAAEKLRPWYQQAWPWFLISLPASAVIGGIITLMLAVKSPNALVVDDYYKEGLAINQEKHRLATADTMAMAGLLRSDGKQLTLSLTSQPAVTEQALTLSIIHSTRADLDRELTLQRMTDGRYAADLPMLPPGSWYLRLQAGDGSWQIRSRITIDGPFQARLAANN